MNTFEALLEIIQITNTLEKMMVVMWWWTCVSCYLFFPLSSKVGSANHMIISNPHAEVQVNGLNFTAGQLPDIVIAEVIILVLAYI